MKDKSKHLYTVQLVFDIYEGNKDFLVTEELLGFVTGYIAFTNNT